VPAKVTLPTEFSPPGGRLPGEVTLAPPTSSRSTASMRFLIEVVRARYRSANNDTPPQQQPRANRLKTLQGEVDKYSQKNSTDMRGSNMADSASQRSAPETAKVKPANFSPALRRTAAGTLISARSHRRPSRNRRLSRARGYSIRILLDLTGPVPVTARHVAPEMTSSGGDYSRAGKDDVAYPGAAGSRERSCSCSARNAAPPARTRLSCRLQI